MTVWRKAWRMRLKPGAETAYDRAHADIWPELVDVMRTSGVVSFAIYRDGLDVFAFQTRSSPFPDAGAPVLDVALAWWREMEPLMVVSADGRPARTDMTEVFVLNDEREDAWQG